MPSINSRAWCAVLAAVLLSAVAAGARADSRETIDSNTLEALARLREHAKGSEELLDRAAGVLVFPDVVKMGFGVGGEFGEGALLVDGATAAYYVTAGASFGLQAGDQLKSEVILFMTEEALHKFRNSRGWEIGVDGSVVLVELGAGGTLNTRNLKAPVLGFIFSNKGLMYNLTFEGSKITRVAR